jgi:hypothetical protein
MSFRSQVGGREMARKRENVVDLRETQMALRHRKLSRSGLWVQGPWWEEMGALLARCTVEGPAKTAEQQEARNMEYLEVQSRCLLSDASLKPHAVDYLGHDKYAPVTSHAEIPRENVKEFLRELALTSASSRLCRTLTLTVVVIRPRSTS